MFADRDLCCENLAECETSRQAGRGRISADGPDGERADCPGAPQLELLFRYGTQTTTNKMDPRYEQRAVELRTARAFPGGGSRAVTVLMPRPCCLGRGGRGAIERDSATEIRRSIVLTENVRSVAK